MSEAGLRVAQGRAGDELARGIVEHVSGTVAFGQKAAVAVRGVFAEAHVGDDLKVGPVFFQATYGALNDAVFRIGFAALFILCCRNAEEHERSETGVHGFAHLPFQLIYRHLIHAGQRGYGLAEVFVVGVHHDVAHHEVRGAEGDFFHHFTNGGIAAQTTSAEKVLHVILRCSYAVASPMRRRSSLFSMAISSLSWLFRSLTA